METRLHPREHVDMSVMLVRQGHVFASAKAVNLSKGGVCIENPEVHLNKGQILDVNLSKPGYPRGTRLFARAMVIHIEHNTVGLMFANDVSMNE